MLTVKKVCVLLTGDSGEPIQGDKKLWEAIWHKGEVLPRVRVFMWKLLHEGVPLASILQRRFPSVNPICATCGDNDEDVHHLAYACHLSRACHFSGPIALRSDNLPISFHVALTCLLT